MKRQEAQEESETSHRLAELLFETASLVSGEENFPIQEVEEIKLEIVTGSCVKHFLLKPKWSEVQL